MRELDFAVKRKAVDFCGAERGKGKMSERCGNEFNAGGDLLHCKKEKGHIDLHENGDWQWWTDGQRATETPASEPPARPPFEKWWIDWSTRVNDETEEMDSNFDIHGQALIVGIARAAFNAGQAASSHTESQKIDFDTLRTIGFDIVSDADADQQYGPRWTNVLAKKLEASHTELRATVQELIAVWADQLPKGFVTRLEAALSGAGREKMTNCTVCEECPHCGRPMILEEQMRLSCNSCLWHRIGHGCWPEDAGLKNRTRLARGHSRRAR